MMVNLIIFNAEMPNGFFLLMEVYAMGLPSQVEVVRLHLEKFPQPELSEIAGKLLIPNDQELCSMWATLEKYSFNDDALWVWGYLDHVKNSLDLPSYHDLDKKSQKELINDIQAISKELVEKLVDNKLDATLVHSNGLNFRGFYLYEDFSESKQREIDGSNTSKLLASSLITQIVSRAIEKIEKEPIQGKSGKNAEAIKFIRMMVSHHQRNYQTPLNRVVVNLVNALFETLYVESDIRNLMRRKPLQS